MAITVNPQYTTGLSASRVSTSIQVTFPVHYYLLYDEMSINPHEGVTSSYQTLDSTQDSTTRLYKFELPANLTTDPKQYYVTFSVYTDPPQTEYAYIGQVAGTATPTVNILGNNPINVTNGSGSYNISVEYTNAGGPSYTAPIVTRGLQYVTASLISTSSNGGDFTGHYNIIVNPNHDTQAGVTGSVEFDVFDSPNGGNRLAYSVLDFYIPYTEEPTPPEPPTPAFSASVTVNPYWNYVSGSGGTASIQVNYRGAVSPYYWYPYEIYGVDSLYYSETTVAQDTESITRQYDFYVPAMEVYVPGGTRDWFPTFSMISGSDMITASAVIHQYPKELNPQVNVVSTNPVTASAASIQGIVEYTESYGTGSILASVVQGQAYVTIDDSWFTGPWQDYSSSFRGIYSLGIHPDWMADRPAAVEFNIMDGDERAATDTLYILVPRDYSTQDIWVVPPSRSLAWDVTTTTADVMCYHTRFSGANPDQLTWTYNGNITSVVTGSKQWDYSTQTYTVPCTFTVSANTTTSPVTSSVTFSISPSGKQTVFKIYQAAYDPTAYSIQAPEYIIVEAEGGNGIEAGTVVYSGITSSSQIGTETYSGNVGITALDTVGSTNNSRTYTIDVEPNTGTTPLTSSITWSIKDTPVTAVTKVYQKAPFLGIIVTPENSNVAYSNTSTTLYVTYSNALLYGYVTQSPVSTDDLTLVSSTTSGNHIYARYTLNYPANTGNSSISHTATFSMVSGSDTISKTATVNQSGIPSGQGISLNRTNQVIEYYETSTQVIATYYGISSIDAVALPTINSSEWTATIASYTESTGQVQVTWNIQGTTNPAAGARTITFTFSAAGISSTATFALVQNGTGSTQVVNDIIPAWKDTETEVGGDNWEVLAQDSRGIVLFDERIYRAPDRETLTVNFNRIAESFLEPREFPVISATTPIFYYTARFAGGPAYGWWVVDDWSYERENMNDVFALSDPYQKEVAGGQYLIFSALNVAEALPLTLNLNGYEVGNVEGAPYSYVDIVNKVIDCGEWSVVAGTNTLATFKTTDAKYVIYYYNRFGGWDSFVVKGPVVPSVNTTRSNYLNYRRNTRTYQVGVVDSYKINTGILLDSVSPVVGEMTASPRLILHDLKEDKLIPVKVTTNSVEVKTFRNQGRKFAEYQFNLEADLNKIRR